MRLISFAKTIEQVKRQEKTVTRRDAWEWLEEGTLLRPVDKVMGFEKGESPTPLLDGAVIRVTSVTREPLEAIEDEDRELEHDEYLGDGSWRFKAEGSIVNDECIREGLPHMTGSEFVDFFCEEMGCQPDNKVTRIEFEYVDEEEETDE